MTETIAFVAFSTVVILLALRADRIRNRRRGRPVMMARPKTRYERWAESHGDRW